MNRSGGWALWKGTDKQMALLREFLEDRAVSSPYQLKNTSAETHTKSDKKIYTALNLSNLNEASMNPYKTYIVQYVQFIV